MGSGKWLDFFSISYVSKRFLPPFHPLFPSALDASLDLAYAHYSLETGRGPAPHHAQLQQRLQRFKQVHARVSAHNADPARTYTMQLGRCGLMRFPSPTPLTLYPLP